MPSDTEDYRGYIINWDVIDDAVTGLWKGTGAVETQPDASGSTQIFSGARKNLRFQTCEEAKEHILRTAKEWIDDNVNRGNVNGSRIVEALTF